MGSVSWRLTLRYVMQKAAAVYGRVHKSSGKIRPGVARGPSRKKRPGPDSSFARGRVPKDLVRGSSAG